MEQLIANNNKNGIGEVLIFARRSTKILESQSTCDRTAENGFEEVNTLTTVVFLPWFLL